jgi:hypothetical protein
MTYIPLYRQVFFLKEQCVPFFGRGVFGRSGRPREASRDHGGKYTDLLGAGIAVWEPISIVGMLRDGSLRLILRWRRARMRWKLPVRHFPINVMKCYGMSRNVMKKCKML